jgi:hypothetical protein
MLKVNKFLKQYRLIFFFTLGISLVLVSWYVALQVSVKNYQTNAKQTIDLQISEQALAVSNLAALTAIAATDDVVSNIITDCQERARFDVLLSKLSQDITNSELNEVSRLFDQCANFYAHRRSIMSLRLKREVELLEDYYLLKQTLFSEADERNEKIVTHWQAIADAEISIAQHFTQLVSIQGNIINQLLAGKNATSPEIKTILEEARSINMQIAFHNTQVERNRTQLQEL